jgi:hypothetical protein
MTQHLLVNEQKGTYEYDPERALRVWRALLGLIPEGDERGYAEHENLTDEGRIIGAFELLDGSQFGDMVFGNTDLDQGSELVERRDDE